MAIFSLTFVATSCSSDDNTVEEIVVKETGLQLNLKSDFANEYIDAKVEFVELNTAKKEVFTIKSDKTELKIAKGSYKITLNGKATNKEKVEFHIGASGEVDIVSDNQTIDLEIFVKSFANDFIIEEIFFTGVLTNEGKQYTNGKYFKLTNNTDKELKTGGLLILQSEFYSTLDHKVTPNIKEKAFAVKGVLMIHEKDSKNVKPGDFIIIADNAIDHSVSNGYDLTKADYEFPNRENPKLGQVDNPQVPDAEVIYTTMAMNMFFMHNRGFESYAIARFPEGVTKEAWMLENVYSYSYVNAAGNITEKKGYSVPNEWILDGVNCSIPTKWEQNLLGSSIDSGWTSVGTIDSDPLRYGKTVRRKIVGQMENGKHMYQDTNNSTDDFVPDSEASLKKGIVH